MLSAMPDPVIGRAPAGLGASSWCTWSRAERLCRRRSREGCSPAMSPTASGSTRCPVPEQRACGGVRKRHLLRLYGCATLRCPPAPRSRCRHRVVSVGASPSCGVATTLDPRRCGRRSGSRPRRIRPSVDEPRPRRRQRRRRGAIVDAGDDADLVAVGSRGLGTWGSLLLGSVGAQVPLHACESVAVVPAAIANDTDLPDTSSARSSP